MTNVADKVSAYIAPEVTFGTDPDADGSDYLPLQVQGAPFASDDYVMEDSDYATGRNRHTEMTPVAQSATASLEMPLTGLSAYANDGTAPPTADGLDLILNSIFGTGSTFSGEGLASSGHTTTSAVSDTDILAVEDLALINLVNGRSGWAGVTAEAAGPVTYTLAPALAAAPDPAGDIMGARWWTPADGGGASLSILMSVDGTFRRLAGCRPSSLKISQTAGSRAMMSVGVKADGIYRETSHSSLPGISEFTNPAIKGALSRFVWGSTEYAVKSVEIDFGLTVTDVSSIAGANGRGDIFVVSVRPTITIMPLFATGWEDDFQAGTERSVLVQFGSGARVNGRCSSVGFFAQAAQVTAQKDQDDGGLYRKSITLRVQDAGIRTGTTAYRHFTLARS
jgi:hypothetical protein